MMQTDFAMYIGIVYSYLPFMILPLYSNLEKHDQTLLEAAVDLGATPFRAFLQITLPLSMPGVIAGSMLVFIPAVGEFVIPRLLGGTDSLMIGRVLWDEFFSNRDWPVASAVAICLLLVLVLPDHDLPALPDAWKRAETRAAMNSRPLVLPADRAGARLRVPLHPDPVGDRLFVQRIEARHGVGRLLDPVVRRAVQRPADARRRVAQPAHRGRDGDGRRDRRHARRASCSRASADSAGARCSPAW